MIKKEEDGVGFPHPPPIGVGIPLLTPKNEWDSYSPS